MPEQELADGALRREIFGWGAGGYGDGEVSAFCEEGGGFECGGDGSEVLDVDGGRVEV